VQLFHWEMDNPAYRDLSANARAIYTEIKRRYNGSNNGFIVYSVRQAADELGIGKTTAANALTELETHGFIVAEQRGAFHWKIDVTRERHRPASEWRLTVYHSDRAIGIESKYPTKEFMRWPEIQNTVRPQVRLVSNTGPYSSPSGTIKNENSPNGTSTRTINAV
jgi:DNA-binding transcriptional MocR family regulator